MTGRFTRSQIFSQDAFFRSNHTSKATIPTMVHFLSYAAHSQEKKKCTLGYEEMRFIVIEVIDVTINAISLSAE
jgi:hypothetical protein